MIKRKPFYYLEFMKKKILIHWFYCRRTVDFPFWVSSPLWLARSADAVASPYMQLLRRAKSFTFHFSTRKQQMIISINLRCSTMTFTWCLPLCMKWFNIFNIDTCNWTLNLIIKIYFKRKWYCKRLFKIIFELIFEI